MSATQHQSGELSLERCPRCGYPTLGLPVVNACPECGLLLDRRWHVFGGRYPNENLPTPASRAIWFLKLGLSTILLIAALSGFALIAGMNWLIFVVVSIPAVWFLRALVESDSSPRDAFVALEPIGLVVCDECGNIQSYPWPLIERVRIPWLGSFIYFENGAGLVVALNRMLYGLKSPQSARLFSRIFSLYHGHAEV